MICDRPGHLNLVDFIHSHHHKARTTTLQFITRSVGNIYQPELTHFEFQVFRILLNPVLHKINKELGRQITLLTTIVYCVGIKLLKNDGSTKYYCVSVVYLSY